MRFRFPSWLVVVLAAAAARGQENPRAALAAHRYADALAGADAALRADPADAQASLIRSLALAGLGEPARSLSGFDRTLVLTHDAVPVLEAAAQVAYSARDKRAGRYLDLLLARDPANPTAHAMAGVLAYERHDCPGADAHFGQAGAALDGNLPAELEHADCLLAGGGADAGTALLDRLAAEHPSDPTVAYDRAAAYVRTGRPAEAVPVLQGLEAAGQGLGGDTVNLLGAALSGSGQVEAAIAAYRQGAAEHPHDERNYIDLAALSVEHQSPEAALTVLDAGLAQNPGSAALLTLRGAVRAQMGQNEAATGDFEAAERLQPSKLYGAVGLGVLLRDGSKLPEAERLLRERLRAHPGDATLCYLLADVLVREGAAPGEPRFAEARGLLRKAVAGEPALAAAHGELGKLDLQAGDTAAAVRELELGVRYDAGDRTSLNQLVAAYRRMGRTEDAQKATARLAEAVERDRNAENERNRVHLIPAAEPR